MTNYSVKIAVERRTRLRITQTYWDVFRYIVRIRKYGKQQKAKWADVLTLYWHIHFALEDKRTMEWRVSGRGLAWQANKGLRNHYLNKLPFGVSVSLVVLYWKFSISPAIWHAAQYWWPARFFQPRARFMNRMRDRQNSLVLVVFFFLSFLKNFFFLIKWLLNKEHSHSNRKMV